MQQINDYGLFSSGVLPDGNGGFTPCPCLMTEEEVIRFLRIPETSKAQNYNNVVVNLKRMQGLPSIHICRQPMYPRDAIMEWIQKKIDKEMRGRGVA